MHRDVKAANAACQLCHQCAHDWLALTGGWMRCIGSARDAVRRGAAVRTR